MAKRRGDDPRICICRCIRGIFHEVHSKEACLVGDRSMSVKGLMPESNFKFTIYSAYLLF